MNSNEHVLILIVDDNPTNCELLHRRLTRQGYSCAVAYSGKQMFDMIQIAKPNLILLDLMMPEMDGLEVLQILRETESPSDLPVLIVTAKNAREDVVSAFEYGANDYIEKPIDFPILMARLKHQLEHKRLQDESLKVRTQLKERNVQWQQAHKQKIDLLAALSQALLQPTQALLLDSEQAKQSSDTALQGKIARRSRHLHKLAQDLRDLARIEAGQLELEFRPTDFYVFLSSLITPFQAEAQTRNINFEIHVDEDLGVVECDPARIQQILSNLLYHALASVEPGAQMSLSALLHQSDSILIRVQFPSKYHKSSPPSALFDPFAVNLSAEAETIPEATGLGLVLVNKLVGLHQGLVQAEQTSEGSRLDILLPYRPVNGQIYQTD